jgi:guanylate kinase
MKMGKRNNIFVISAPSGAGKTTLVQRLLDRVPNLFFSISHTTRPMREGEKEGIDYYFVPEPTFQRMISNQEFLEWAKVHGHCYGTSKQMIRLAEEADKDLILDVDVQGAASVSKLIPGATSIFIMPPSYESLRERLVQRRTDNEEQIEERLENAREEIQHYREYDYIVINEELNSAFENLCGIIRGKRCLRELLEARVQEILKTFDHTS